MQRVQGAGFEHRIQNHGLNRLYGEVAVNGARYKLENVLIQEVMGGVDTDYCKP